MWHRPCFLVTVLIPVCWFTPTVSVLLWLAPKMDKWKGLCQGGKRPLKGTPERKSCRVGVDIMNNLLHILSIKATLMENWVSSGFWLKKKIWKSFGHSHLTLRKFNLFRVSGVWTILQSRAHHWETLWEFSTLSQLVCLSLRAGALFFVPGLTQCSCKQKNKLITKKWIKETWINFDWRLKWAFCTDW